MLPDPVVTLVLFSLHLTIDARLRLIPSQDAKKFDNSDRPETLVTSTLVAPEIVEKPTCQRQ